MISWDHIAVQTGLSKLVAPKSVFKYAAYNKGQVTWHNTSNEALKVSKNIERVKDEDSIRDEENYNQQYSILYTETFNIWYSGLREEYSYLNDEVFKLCYNKAYEDGHSSGYDEVANEMIGVVEFAENIIKG